MQKVNETLLLGQEFSKEAMTVAGQIADNLQKHDPSGVWHEGGLDRTLLHGIVGGVTAGLTGGSVLGGAGGAMAGEQVDVAARNLISKALVGKSTSVIDQISGLGGNIAAGLTGSIVGGVLGGKQGASRGGPG